MRTSARSLALLLLAPLLLAVAACGDTSSAPEGAGDDAAAGDAPQALEAWARPAQEGMNSAVYLRLVGGAEDDELLGAAFEGAESTMLHETVADGDLVRMEHLMSLPLAAGEDVAFEPGGKHVMLMGLQAPLEAGQRITVTLDFAQAGSLDVEAEVRQDG